MRKLLLTIFPAYGLSRSLASTTLWSICLRVAGMATTFLVGVQLARYLKPAGFGTYGVLMALVALLGVAAQIGSPGLATREVAAARTLNNWPVLGGVLKWLTIAVTLVSLLLSAMLLAAVLLWPKPIDAAFRTAAIWGSLLVPLMTITTLISAQLRGLHRIIKGQLLDILIRPLIHSILCLAIFLLYGRLSPATAIALHALAALVALAIGVAWLVTAIPPQVRGARPVAHFRSWLTSATPLWLIDGLRQLDGVYAILLMGLITTAAETGTFRVAVSSAVPLALPITVLNVVLAPTIGRFYELGDRRRLQLLLGASAAAMFGAALLITLTLAVMGKWLIVSLFGPEYAGAATPLLILSAAQTVNGFCGVGTTLLVMVRAERPLMLFFALSVTAGILLAVPLITLHGANGAATAALISTTINALLTWRYSRKNLHLEPSLLGASAFLRHALPGFRRDAAARRPGSLLEDE